VQNSGLPEYGAGSARVLRMPVFIVYRKTVAIHYKAIF